MKKKIFDCVLMKKEIQLKLREEEKGLSPEQRRNLMHRKIHADPIFGAWFQKTMKRQPTQAVVSCVAESRAKYGQPAEA